MSPAQRKPAKGRRRIPVWARIAVLVGLALFAYQQYGYWSIPSSARQAGAGLQASSVYADPSEPDVIDVDRARQVIGDRPILVAVLPADYPKRELAACEDVAKQHAKNLVLTYTGAQSPALCAGPKFPNPTTGDGDVDGWVFQVLLETQYASDYRVSADDEHRTAEVEELVLAFDAEAKDAYADGVPNRRADPDPLVWWRVVLELAGLVLLTVLVFFGIRLAAKKVIRVRAERSALRSRRLDLQQQLSAAAAQVMVDAPVEGPAKAQLRAEVAQQYLHTLTGFEAARTQADLNAIQADFTALGAKIEELNQPEEAVSLLTKLSKTWRSRR